MTSDLKQSGSYSAAHAVHTVWLLQCSTCCSYNLALIVPGTCCSYSLALTVPVHAVHTVWLLQYRYMLFIVWLLQYRYMLFIQSVSSVSFRINY